MYRILLTFCAFCALQTTCGEQSSLYLDEIRSLSELPMDKLIQIKSSLASENGEPVRHKFPMRRFTIEEICSTLRDDFPKHI